MAATGPMTPMIVLARAALGEPLTRRARDELLFCLVGVLVGLAVLAVVMALLGIAVFGSVEAFELRLMTCRASFRSDVAAGNRNRSRGWLSKTPGLLGSSSECQPCCQ